MIRMYNQQGSRIVAVLVSMAAVGASNLLIAITLALQHYKHLQVLYMQRD